MSGLLRGPWAFTSSTPSVMTISSSSTSFLQPVSCQNITSWYTALGGFGTSAPCCTCAADINIPTSARSTRIVRPCTGSPSARKDWLEVQERWRHLVRPEKVQRLFWQLEVRVLPVFSLPGGSNIMVPSSAVTWGSVWGACVLSESSCERPLCAFCGILCETLRFVTVSKLLRSGASWQDS